MNARMLCLSFIFACHNISAMDVDKIRKKFLNAIGIDKRQSYIDPGYDITIKPTERSFLETLNRYKQYANNTVAGHDYIKLINKMESANKQAEINIMGHILTKASDETRNMRDNRTIIAGGMGVLTTYGLIVAMHGFISNFKENIVPATGIGIFAASCGLFTYCNAKIARNAHKLANYFDFTREKFFTATNSEDRK